MRRALPRPRVIGKELTQLLQHRRFWMPHAAADDTLARLDVQIEPLRLTLVPALVVEARSLQALVRLLVIGETCIAMQAIQRSAHLARIGTEMWADLAQRRGEVTDQREERLAHVALVVVLVILEPFAVVVADQRFEEAERGGREIGLGHGSSEELLTPRFQLVEQGEGRAGQGTQG